MALISKFIAVENRLVVFCSFTTPCLVLKSRPPLNSISYAKGLVDITTRKVCYSICFFDGRSKIANENLLTNQQLFLYLHL